jgi:hypothetical protein
VFAFGIPAVPVFCGAYVFALGIVALGVAVPGAVAGGIPGVVVVVPVVVVPLVVPAAGGCVAANAAPAPSAVSTTAKVAFLAAIFIRVPPFGCANPRYSPNAATATMFRIAAESPQFTSGHCTRR